jgi:hypothetical protein
MPWDWRTAAACRLADGDLFFGPERGRAAIWAAVDARHASGGDPA